MSIESLLSADPEFSDLSPDFDRRISQAEYDAWRRHFVFDGLRHLRYGQSFCRYFDIRDSLIYYAQTVREADEYIQKWYVR